MRQDERKIHRRLRRKRHIRRKLSGSAQKPRLTVFRSHQNISCQLIDDVRGVTLVSASTLEKELKGALGKKGGNCAAAVLVGQSVAEKAKGLGIQKVAFDRNGYRFHGRVKALADSARKAGLVF
jgi:large subunit ribosomal protein L18